MLVVCTDCNGKWLMISKFNLDSSKQTLLAPFLVLLFFCFSLNQYCLPRRQNIKCFWAKKHPGWLERHLWREDKRFRRKTNWFGGVQLWEKGAPPQLQTSLVMRGRSLRLSGLVYLGYNLSGATSTSFVQCQAQSGPARCRCPLALPWYQR